MGSSMYGGGGYAGYGVGSGVGYGSYGGFGGMMGDPNDPNGLSRRMESGTQGTPSKQWFTPFCDPG
jgi:peroxin-13